jgi:hypothetical protein
MCASAPYFANFYYKVQIRDRLTKITKELVIKNHKMQKFLFICQSRHFRLTFNTSIQMLQAKNCANKETFCYGTFFKEICLKLFIEILSTHIQCY